MGNQNRSRGAFHGDQVFPAPFRIGIRIIQKIPPMGEPRLSVLSKSTPDDYFGGLQHEMDVARPHASLDCISWPVPLEGGSRAPGVPRFCQGTLKRVCAVRAIMELDCMEFLKFGNDTVRAFHTAGALRLGRSAVRSPPAPCAGSTSPCDISFARSAAASPALFPKTRRSKENSPLRRFAPCRPDATSPAAYNPGTFVSAVSGLHPNASHGVMDRRIDLSWAVA